jgi:hypothetical protein
VSKAESVLDALLEAVDHEKLERSLATMFPAEKGAAGPSAVAQAVLDRLLLSDVLDDSILASKPGDSSFPLRVFFGELGQGLDDDVAFALAAAINFYFRVPLEEEARIALGIEVSRLYYSFAEKRPLDPAIVKQLSPLVAKLLSTELERVRFESVDGDTTFDSTVHERALGSSASKGTIRTPKTFLCRVVSNSMVRNKAVVKT